MLGTCSAHGKETPPSAPRGDRLTGRGPRWVRGGGTGSGLPPLTPLSPLQRRKAPHEGVYNVSRGTISLRELGRAGRRRAMALWPLHGPCAPLRVLSGARLLRWPHGDCPEPGWCRQAAQAPPREGPGQALPVARSWSPPECCPRGKAPSPPRCGSDGKGTRAGRGHPSVCS